ncbi:Tyrosine recombinase XerC [Pseudoalteromonas sp. P1-30]|uniref:tyrosine-type recombinase/integrase n=1 Tax=Pseudoalteromonas TaxID=53246 RepID=UPI0006D63BD8|nr:site-specific integrase [Pseudoalteromonas sp. P1-30]KPV91548.1 Tyrosine recombinase XerC [Pseudoalteromonas sp. P1-30]MCQ8822481.1 site-specific integrase [Pseudoalteromonas agarivorans]
MAKLIRSALVKIKKSETELEDLESLPTLYTSDARFVHSVNAWFYDLVACKRLKDLNSYSRALLCYWSYLEVNSLNWDEFPPIKRLKPTYKFKYHLLSEVNSRKISPSTANLYLKHVVQFYIWAIEESEIEINDEKTAPFVIEFISIKRTDKLAHLKPKFIVQTTDLKIRVPKKSESGLSPLTSESLLAFSNKLKSEPIEFKLMCALALLSGLRKSEACSFTQEALNSAIPTSNSHTRYTLTLGPSTGVNTKYNKQREIEVPATLFNKLKDYSISERRLKKIQKLKIRGEYEPLFISQYGNQAPVGTLSARWSDFRKIIKFTHSNFHYSFHDLRSTYATYRLNDLLDAGLGVGEALDCLMHWMGHDQESTTMKYIRYLQKKTALENKFGLLDQIMHNAIESEGFINESE